MNNNFCFDFREQVNSQDAKHVRDIVSSTGFFSADEIETAVELVNERLSRGISSGYHFLFAEKGGEVFGYSCFGPIACTEASYDLYWIAVTQARRGCGAGGKLLAASEQAIAKLGGCRIYVETSSRPQYEPTRKFYLNCGYREEAVLRDFYASGDSKVVYLKEIGCNL